jgi:transposase
MKKRYVVRLTSEEREQLQGLVQRGREAAYRRRHAQVLLLADEGEQGEGLIDREVAERVGCTRRTVEQIRERCVCEGLQAALERKKRSRERSRVLDGEGEARLVRLACSEPPTGRARWTLKMLRDRLVELEVVESISTEAVRQVLKKHHQTLAEAHGVHPGAGERGVRVPNGSGAGRVSTTS